MSWGHNYPNNETDNFYVLFEMRIGKNHGTACREPAPLHDEGFLKKKRFPEGVRTTILITPNSEKIMSVAPGQTVA